MNNLCILFISYYNLFSRWLSITSPEYYSCTLFISEIKVLRKSCKGRIIVQINNTIKLHHPFTKINGTNFQWLNFEVLTILGAFSQYIIAGVIQECCNHSHIILTAFFTGFTSNLVGYQFCLSKTGRQLCNSNLLHTFRSIAFVAVVGNSSCQLRIVFAIILACIHVFH